MKFPGHKNLLDIPAQHIVAMIKIFSGVVMRLRRSFMVMTGRWAEGPSQSWDHAIPSISSTPAALRMELAGKLMQLMGYFYQVIARWLLGNNPFIAAITSLHSCRPGFDIWRGGNISTLKQPAGLTLFRVAKQEDCEVSRLEGGRGWLQGWLSGNPGL